MKKLLGITFLLALGACATEAGPTEADNGLCLIKPFTYPPSNTVLHWNSIPSPPQTIQGLQWYHGPLNGPWYADSFGPTSAAGSVPQFHPYNGCCVGTLETQDTGGSVVSCSHDMEMTLYSSAQQIGSPFNPGGRSGCQYYLKQTHGSVCRWTGGNAFTSVYLPAFPTAIYQRVDGTWNMDQVVTEGIVGADGKIWIARITGQLH